MKSKETDLLSHQKGKSGLYGGIVFAGLLLAVGLFDLRCVESLPKSVRGQEWVDGTLGVELKRYFTYDYSSTFKFVRPFLAEWFYLNLKETQPEVHLGVDRWLYSEMEIRDRQYPGIKGRKIVNQSVADLVVFQRFLKDHQIDLMVVIVPNRLRMYPEHLFPSGQVPEYLGNRYQTFTDHLILNGIMTVDLEEVLRKEKLKDLAGDLLYETVDHHWTSRGCLVSMKEVARQIRSSHPDLCDSNPGITALQDPVEMDGNQGLTQHMGLNPVRAKALFIKPTKMTRVRYLKNRLGQERMRSRILLIGDSFVTDNPEPLAAHAYLEHFLQTPVDGRYLKGQTDPVKMLESFLQSKAVLEKKGSLLVLEFWEPFMVSGKITEIGPLLLEEFRKTGAPIPVVRVIPRQN